MATENKIERVILKLRSPLGDQLLFKYEILNFFA
jgi:hypothetical protein